jgi:hypothetical protein
MGGPAERGVFLYLYPTVYMYSILLGYYVI